MIGPVARKTAQKFWCGLKSHPFLEAFDREISKDGFSFEGHDDDAPCSVWSRPLFEKNSLELCVWPQPSRSQGSFGVLVTLGVSSALQAEVQTFLQVAKCWGDEPAEFKAVSIFSVSLNWLVGAWGEYSFASAFDRWKDRDNSESETVAGEIGIAFRKYGAELSLMIQTPAALAAVLARLPDFPGATGLQGRPASASAREYAAVLYDSIGETELALTQLGRWMEDAEHRFSSEADLDPFRCANDRYLRWVQKSQ